MIDYSLCPNPFAKKGVLYTRGVIEGWIKSVGSVTGNLDATGGKLKAAVTSTTPIFVTSYLYTINMNTSCLNIMLERKDYRLIIGFDDRVVRIEGLDARAARAQTKKEVEYWAQNAQSGTEVTTNAPAVVNAPGSNYGMTPGCVRSGTAYANVPSSSANAYGVPIPANPYGVKIPVK